MSIQHGRFVFKRRPIIASNTEQIRVPMKTKKIAICFFGQIRQGSVGACENILRYLGDLRNECDIFVHTWDVESRGNGIAHLSHEGPPINDQHWYKHTKGSQESIQYFYSQFKPRCMEVEEYNLQDTLPLWGGRRFDPVMNKWSVSLWKSVQECNRMKIRYAEKNNLKYTYTLQIRSDLVFSPEKSLAEDISQIPNENTLLFADFFNVFPSQGQERLEDVMWLAHTPVIDKVASFSDYYSSTVSNINDPNDPGYKDWQLYCAEWITKTLGLSFRPLLNSRMRVYSYIDIEKGIDPMNPGFGNPPGRFGQVR